MSHPVIKNYEVNLHRAIMWETDTGWRIVKYQERKPGSNVWLDVEHTEHPSFVGADHAYDSIMKRHFPHVVLRQVMRTNEVQAQRILHLTILAIGCSKHPSYRVKREPRADCDCCLKMWKAHLALQEMAKSGGPSNG